MLKLLKRKYFHCISLFKINSGYLQKCNKPGLLVLVFELILAIFISVYSVKSEYRRMRPETSKHCSFQSKNVS